MIQIYANARDHSIGVQRAQLWNLCKMQHPQTNPRGSSKPTFQTNYVELAVVDIRRAWCLWEKDLLPFKRSMDVS